MIATASKPIRKRRQTRARRPRRTGSVYAKPFIYADFSPRVQYGPNLYAGYYAQGLGMDPWGLGFENDFQEKLNEQAIVPAKNPMGKESGRGYATLKWSKGPSFACIAADDKKEGCPHILFLEGTLEAKVFVLAKGHKLYKDHNPIYNPDNKAWSDDKERDAVINHERDHYQTITRGLWPILEIANKYDLSFYETNERCNLCGQMLAFFAEMVTERARAHALKFDGRGWNIGGQYNKHPFPDNADRALIEDELQFIIRQCERK